MKKLSKLEAAVVPSAVLPIITILLTVQTVGLKPDNRDIDGYTVQKWVKKLHRYRNRISTIVTHWEQTQS